MSSASKASQFVFKARTTAGFGLKILSEYLSNLLKFPPFAVNERGIFVRGMDQHGEVLVDVEMLRENFTVFKCPKPIHFSVNANHFYRLLKTIKKKDTVSLFIQEQRPMQLGICVEQGEERGDRITTYIQISWVSPSEIELPEGYEQPIVEISKRFQRLKMLHSIGPELKATVIGGRTIMFFVNGKNLYSREVTLGEDPDDEGADEGGSYTLTYTTSHITQLTKCAGQSGNIQIFHHEELPLFIKMKIVTLATVAVYIKSHELIEQLENDPEEEDEPEDTEATDSTSPTAPAKAQVQIEDGGDEAEGEEEGEAEDDAEDEPEEKEGQAAGKEEAEPSDDEGDAQSEEEDA